MAHVVVVFHCYHTLYAIIHFYWLQAVDRNFESSSSSSSLQPTRAQNTKKQQKQFQKKLEKGGSAAWNELILEDALRPQMHSGGEKRRGVRGPDATIVVFGIPTSSKSSMTMAEAVRELSRKILSSDRRKSQEEEICGEMRWTSPRFVLETSNTHTASNIVAVCKRNCNKTQMLL